jgi:hypothetical protein
MPNGTATTAATAQRIGLSGFDFGVVHPLMDQSLVFILVNDG